MQNNVSSFTVCFPFDSEVLLQIHSRLGQFIVFSRKNMQLTEIIYHRKRKNQGGLPPCKQSAVKRNTSTRRQAATSRAAQADLFTSGMKWSVFIRRRAASYGGTSKQGFSFFVKMSRLHCITPWQGRKPSVLSEVVLRTVKIPDNIQLFSR